MEENGKHVNLYRGIWWAFIGMFTLPGACFGVFFAVIDAFFHHPLYITCDISLAFAGLVGVLFVIICLLAGLADGLFSGIGDRIAETREMFGGVFNKYGFKWYWQRFVDDGGIIFWTAILILLLYAGLSAYGFINFFIWYIPNH